MSASEGQLPSLSADNFRARRDYLPDDAFALVTGSYGLPRDLIAQDQWEELINLPTDVLLRTSDNHGTPLAQMNRLWGIWVETLPIEVEAAPFMHNAGWDAADDFNASTFVTAHGYYRQGMASLRSALEGLAAAASFAVSHNTEGLENWFSGQSAPPRPVAARRLLAPILGPELAEVLRKLYAELSGYVHSRRDTRNAVLWGGSNGPVWEPDSFQKVYHSFRDVMAMGFVLLAIGWPGYVIPDRLWPLFEQPSGVWADFALDELKRRFGA